MVMLGCGLNFDPQPNPTQFFLMTASPAEATGGPGLLRGKVLGLGPISLAPYVDQQKIVTRVEPNRVEFAEFERWAEAFDEHFTRILARNLHDLTQPDVVEIYPWLGSADVRVEVVVWRFDRLPDGGAAIEVDWFVRDGEGTEIMAHEGVVIEKAPAATGAEGLVRTEDSVRAMSAAVSQLAQDIASAIDSSNLGR
jgi:uncharacterized lipoprotein YmbA